MTRQNKLRYNLKVKALKGFIQQIKWQGVSISQEDLEHIDLKLETPDQEEYIEQIALINEKLAELRDFLNDRRMELARENQSEKPEGVFSLSYYLQDS